MKSSLLSLLALSVLLSGSSLWGQDEYEVIGRYRKKTYDGFASKIAAELFEEGDKSNRLFESMNVELDLSFGPATGRLRYARSVNIDNPKVNSEILSPYDYAEYRVSNTIYSGIDLEFESGVLRSEGKAGVLFGVSKKVVPRHSDLTDKIRSTDTVEDICKRARNSFNPFLNQETRKIIDAKDCSSDKKGFSDWFESFVEKLNSPVRKVLHSYFADSEKVKMYADQPFEALTNYSRYGFPMDLSVFFDSNKMLSVGDSLQHTVFYGWDPISLGANFGLGHFSVSAVKNTRAFRDYRIRKEGNNKVTVQVTDYLEKGHDWQWLKIRPRLLLLFKYTFLDWRDRDFDAMTFRRTYEVDLSSGEIVGPEKKLVGGIDFLKSILRKGYFVDLELNKSRMDEPVDLPVGVEAYKPVFVQGRNASYNFMARFPGLFKLDKRDNLRIQQAWIGKDKTQAESHRAHSIKKKWTKLDWLFDKTDRNTRCSVNTKTYSDDVIEYDYNKALSDKLALNIDCYHSERYPSEDWLMQAWDASFLMTNGNVEPEFREKLKRIKNPTKRDLQWASNVSFNAEHLNNVIRNIRADKNRVAVELADIFFGEKYSSLWAQESNVQNIFGYYRRNKNDYPIYTHALDKYSPLYCDKLEGALGLKPSFPDFYSYYYDKNTDNVVSRQPCYQLVLKVIEPLSRNFNEVANVETSDLRKKTDAVLKRLELIAETFDNREVVFAISMLLQRLAGDSESNPVHLTYSVDSFSFLEPIVYSTGDAFRIDHESISDVIPDVSDFEDTNHRITNALLLKKNGVSKPTSLRLDFFTTHQFPRESLLEVEVREFVPIKKNKYRSKVDRDLTETKLVSSYEIPISEIKSLDKLVNGAKYVYENIRIPTHSSWRTGSTGKTHVMYLRVKNPNQEWLSEESKLQFIWK
jgi:hypothetical protein